MPNFRRFLSRRWLLGFCGAAALVFGIAMSHPYPRQWLFGPTIRGKPRCYWEDQVRWHATHFRDNAKRSHFEKRLRDMVESEHESWPGGTLFNHEDMLPLLLELASDRDDHVRYTAGRAILHNEKLYQESALPLLRELLRDDDPAARVYAAKAIWSITKDKEVLPTVFQVLNTPKAIRWTGPFAVKTYSRGLALSVLSEIAREVPELFPEVVSFANDDDEYVRAGAMHEMRHFGKQAMPTLLQGLDDPDEVVRSAAARSLRTRGPEARDAVPGLERLVQEGKTNARADAIDALIAIDLKRFSHLKTK
jgi:HEAT repeat protein